MEKINRFGERIKELRGDLELSQRQVGQRIGYSQQNISDWEAGRIQPTALAIIACAEFFEVSSDYLLGLEWEDGTKVAKPCLDERSKNTAHARAVSKNKAIDDMDSELKSVFYKLARPDKLRLVAIAKVLLEHARC